jgi:Na+-translocating ferredoxin:NAD+ oxidoreductase RnfG subunit
MKPIDMIKIAINLAVVYVLGGLLIAYIYSYTSPILFQKVKAEKEAALQTMMPEADMVEELGEWEIHGRHAGYYAARKCEEVKVSEITDEKSGNVKEINQ